MYHDQGLIPLKALHFDEGINVTLGLPIVRTSPDHGTAFDIAGKDIADPDAMIAAIRTAGECARRLALREPAAACGTSSRGTASAPRKALGQNFILDEQLLDRIAAVPGAAGRASGSMRSGPGRAG